MNTLRRRWKESALGLLVIAVLYACTLSGEGYVGGVYDPPGYEYGSWGHDYYVAPPRVRGHGGYGGDEHHAEQPRQQQPERHAYRPAPPSRQAPSIPTRPHGH
jgi:hypothetical protein